MNNRLQITGGCAAALVAVAFSWLAIRETKSANANIGPLACSEPVIDAGRIPWEKRELLFSLANHGRQAAVIERVRKSCACTDVALSRRALKSGETATLTCTWDTAGRRGQTSTDLVVEYRVAGDPALHAYRLSATADILPDYLVDAEEIRFFTRESAVRSVRISAVRVPNVRVLAAHSNHAAISTDVNDSSNLEVRYDANKWGDDWGECSIVIETDNAAVPNWRLPVRVFSRRRRPTSD